MRGGKVVKQKAEKAGARISLEIKGCENTSSLQWSSPLPPPYVLEAYSKISPDLLSSLLHIVEKQNEHHSAMERSAQMAQHSVRMSEERTRRLSIAAFLLGKMVAASIALSGFALCGYFVFLGYPKLALVLCGGELFALVTVFLKSRQAEK